MNEVDEAIKALAKKSAAAPAGSEAMHYAQAALNLAHVALSLRSLSHASYGEGAQNGQRQ